MAGKASRQTNQKVKENIEGKKNQRKIRDSQKKMEMKETKELAGWDSSDDDFQSQPLPLTQSQLLDIGKGDEENKCFACLRKEHQIPGELISCDTCEDYFCEECEKIDEKQHITILAVNKITGHQKLP